MLMSLKSIIWRIIEKDIRRRIKPPAAAVLAFVLLAASVMPVFAEENSQYPLKGTFPYTMMTEEIVNNRLAEGWVYAGDPYAEVGTAVPFTNNAEWVQVNQFRSSTATGINSAKILISLAGLTPSPDSYTGSALTIEEEAVKNEVIKYLESYDWKHASDYEKAAYTAEYIAGRCKSEKNACGDSLYINSSYSCLINGQSMCDGFAQTYHLLTRAVGLKSVQVGTLSHAWNYVMIDEQWYEMDVSIVSSPSRASRKEYIDRYLNRIPADINQYLWTEAGVDFNQDSTLADQPLY